MCVCVRVCVNVFILDFLLHRKYVYLHLYSIYQINSTQSQSINQSTLMNSRIKVQGNKNTYCLNQYNNTCCYITACPQSQN